MVCSNQDSQRHRPGNGLPPLKRHFSQRSQLKGTDFVVVCVEINTLVRCNASIHPLSSVCVCVCPPIGSLAYHYRY